MKENGVPLVVIYNLDFKNLSFLIHKNLQFSHADPEKKRVFMPAPFIFFQILRTYPLESKIGSAKLNSKRCQVCLNITKTDTFESFQNQAKVQGKSTLKL